MVTTNFSSCQSFSYTDPQSLIGPGNNFLQPTKEKIQKYLTDHLVASKNLNFSQEKIIEREIGCLIDLACFNLGINNPIGNKVVSLSDITKIADQITEMTLAVGNPNSLADLMHTQVPLSPISPHLRSLISSQLSSIKDLSDWKVIQAIFLKRNPALLEDIKSQLKELLVDLYQKIKSVPATDPQTIVYESTIAYIMSIFTHFCPLDGEVIEIPQLIEGTWRLCNYKPEKIELTPAILGSQIYAYGLQGIYYDDEGVEQTAPPNLLFKGTTFPTDDGAFLSFIVDVNPFLSVGELAFRMGKKNIETWLNKATIDKSGALKKARLNGMSLGGALVSMSLEAFQDKVEFAHAYNPPGIRPGLMNKTSHLEDAVIPKVRILWQSRDIVPSVGSQWNPKCEVVYILGEKSYNPLLSHCKGFVAEEGVVMVKLDNAKVSASPWRRIMNLIYTIICPPIFLLLISVYTAYRLLSEIASLMKRLTVMTLGTCGMED